MDTFTLKINTLVCFMLISLQGTYITLSHHLITIG